MDISVVIPTRGNVDIKPILESLKGYQQFNEFIIADYGENVYNRYLGIKKAKNNIIYTQDDDCIVDPNNLIAGYEEGIIINNMKLERINDYCDNITLIGWGAIFDKKLISVLNGFKIDSLFKRECDRIFTGMNIHKTVSCPMIDLPHASDPTRLFNQKDHWQSLRKIKRRLKFRKFQLFFKKLIFRNPLELY